MISSENISANKNKPLYSIGIEILLISFIVLFQELALIRWMASKVRVVAFFPNLILISAFLGLGLGSLRSGKKSLLWLWPAGVLILTLATIGMSHVIFTQQTPSEFLWLLYYDLPNTSLTINNVYVPIIACFILSAFSFISLGQLLGERIQEFKIRSNALWGYTWDLFGSLCGVIIFTYVSFCQSFPAIWFLFLGLPGFILFKNLKSRLIYVFLFIITILSVFLSEKATTYSPYYALTLASTQNSKEFMVLTNGSFHQYAAELSLRDRDLALKESSRIEGYHVPYRILKTKPKTALVLGAGNGNDVSVLLEHGLEHIDAVEIDPVILEWGRKYHPDNPYSSPKVKIHNTDARSFLNNSKNKYDLIVFGTLDSMTCLSALSNLRLDNFVYTVESLKAVRNLLSENGGLIMYFHIGRDYILNRFIKMLKEVFGYYPVIHDRQNTFFNHIFMTGPAFNDLVHYEDKDIKIFEEQSEAIEMSNDNWPNLYLENKAVSPFYLKIILIIFMFSASALFIVSPKLRTDLFQSGKIDIEMFLFGMAFLLLETRFVTQMNLLWDSTWITSAVVFGAVLLVILSATLAVALINIPKGVGHAGLISSLVMMYFIPVEALLQLNSALKLLLSLIFILPPIFFAGVCFAYKFKQRQNANEAFGWNVLGAVAGGLLEFSSMAIGFKGTLLLTIGIYLLIILIDRLHLVSEDFLENKS